jgi:Transposase IS116/IS110/IS902 family
VDTQIKLSAVVSDMFGVSGRQLLEALIAGQRDPKVLAQLAQGRMRSKLGVLEEALTGHFRAHHGYLLRMMLDRIDALGAQADQLTGRIEELLAPFADQVEQLDEIPGVGRIGAQELIAEIGTEMGRFPSAGHLVSWAKFAPTTNASAGKTKSSSTGKGNPWIGGTSGRRRWEPPRPRPSPGRPLPADRETTRQATRPGRRRQPRSSPSPTTCYRTRRPASPTSAPTSTTASTPNAEPVN